MPSLPVLHPYVNLDAYWKMCGIYKIEHPATGRAYIGSSYNIGNRWRGHIEALNSGLHHSARLQEAWNTFSPEDFTFSVLELVPNRNDLFSREQYWIDFYESYDPELGFNLNPIAGVPVGAVKHERFKPRPEKKKYIPVQKDPRWEITDPDGNQYLIYNLRNFCLEHNLSYVYMSMYARGKAETYNTGGWTCDYIGEKSDKYKNIREIRYTIWERSQEWKKQGHVENASESTLVIRITSRSSRDTTKG